MPGQSALPANRSPKLDAPSPERRGSWRDVAKDMKGRYPKHRWPDEPWAEKPSLKTKNAFGKGEG